MGHFGFELAVFRDTPTGNQLGPPSTSFLRAVRLHPSGVRLRSARYARLRSASPRRGGGEGKKDKLQKDFYTPLASGSYAEFNLGPWAACAALGPAGRRFSVRTCYK